VFRREWLVAAYADRAKYGKQITDDAQLVEAAGHAVHLVAGSPNKLIGPRRRGKRCTC
jgi:2-C-methyl-D-erythritol 4-phosphate cytidylyltransferase